MTSLSPKETEDFPTPVDAGELPRQQVVQHPDGAHLAQPFLPPDSPVNGGFLIESMGKLLCPMAEGSFGAQAQEELQRQEEGQQRQRACLPPEEIWRLKNDARWGHISSLCGSLLKEMRPPTDDKHDLLAFCAKVLLISDCPEKQLEGAWILAFFLSRASEYVKLVVGHDAVPNFIKLLGSQRDDVRELAVLALGHIAGDSAVHRDIVLEKGALDPLLKQLHDHARLSMLRFVAFTLFNFCRDKPQFKEVRPVSSVLQILVFSEDKYVLQYACWALSFLSDGSNDIINDLIEKGVCLRLLELLEHQLLGVQVPALCTVGNIARGDDCQRQYIIDNGVLDRVRKLLVDENDNETVQIEACRTISGITDGNENQIQAVIDAGMIEPLIFILAEMSDNVKKIAGGTVLRVISGGSRFGKKVSGLEGFIKPLCNLLLSKEYVTVECCLDALAILGKPSEEEECPGAYNYFIRLIDEARGFDYIDHLKSNSSDEKIRVKASKIWVPLFREALKVYKFFEELADLGC